MKSTATSRCSASAASARFRQNWCGGSKGDLATARLKHIPTLILRSRALARRLEGRPRVPLPPSFETLAEFIIGPRFARTRWQTPRDEVHGALGSKLDCIPLIHLQ